MAISTIIITATRSGMPSTLVVNRGAPGVKGDKGDTGEDGSEASVTSGNVASVLPAAIEAATPAAVRAAAKTQSSEIGLLQRFARHPDGTEIGTGSLPEIGPAWTLANQSGFGNPVIENRALVAQPGDLIYLGSTIPCPDGRFSATVLVEIRKSDIYTTGVGSGALTVAVNSKAWELGLATFLNGPQTVHAQFSDVGLCGGSLYQEPPTIESDDGALSIGVVPPLNSVFAVKITVEGEVLTVSALGLTKTYRDARYASRVVAGGSGFFVEWGGKATDHKYYFAVHAIAINAPRLEEEMLFFGGDYGAMVARISDRNTVMLPCQNLHLMGGLDAFPKRSPVSSDVLAVAGDAFVDGRVRSAIAATISGTSPVFYAAPGTRHLSAASASDENSLALAVPELTANGTTILAEFGGYFAANANEKRIKITEYGGVTFDTGPLNLSDETWILRVRKTRVPDYIFGGGTKRALIHFEFVSDTVRKMGRNHTSNVFAIWQLKVSGVAAGDVVTQIAHAQILIP